MAPRRATFSVAPGFAPEEHAAVAALYWAAFGGKLARILGPDDTARAYLAAVFDPRFAFTARDESGAVIGVAGFKTHDGALARPVCATLRALYGAVSTPLRMLALEMLDRPVEPNTLLMDGVCVREDARGRGVGAALLDAVAQEAARRGLAEVRLDGVDGNDGARRRYERLGFRPTKHITLGPLRWIFGFRGATTMTRAVALD